MKSSCLQKILLVPIENLVIFIIALGVYSIPAYPADYEHVEMHCPPGGEEIWVAENASHDKIVGAEVYISLEYSSTLRKIVTLDIASVNDVEGRAFTTLQSLQNLVILDTVFTKGERGIVGGPMLKAIDENHTYVIYNFSDTSPTFVEVTTTFFSSSMTWQHCFVISRYKLTR